MPLSLEIHHIDIAGGDCIAIVLRADPKRTSTITKILIDGGCFASGWKRLAGYLKKYFDDRPFDYMIASHYHDDHIVGLAKAGITFKKYIDMGGYDVKGAPKYTPKRNTSATSNLGYYNSYANLIETQIQKNQAKRVPLSFLEEGKKASGPIGIDVDEDGDIGLTFYCGAGYLANGTDVIANQNKGVHPAKVDENDLSLAFLLKWGDFIYYSAADLSGDPTRKSYYNIEDPLITYLQKNALKTKTVTVAKASHHGSNHSSSPGGSGSSGFLDLIQPDTIIVPSNIHKSVPGQNYLERAHKYCKGAKKSDNKTILFSNDLAYGTTDVQYAPLKKIITDKIPSNLEINTADDNLLHNSSPTAIVVQVKSNNKVKNLALDSARILKRTGYTLYIDKSDLPNVSKAAVMVRGITLSSFDDENNIYDSIQNGLKKQAEEMVAWLVRDQMDKTTVAQDWLEFNTPSFDIPALMKAVKSDKKKATQTLTKQCLDLFGETYVKRDGTYLGRQKEGRFKKQTMDRLLRRNPHQATLNKQARWVTNANEFDYDAPYTDKSSNKKKRTQVAADLKANPRRSPRKRQKTTY